MNYYIIRYIDGVLHQIAFLTFDDLRKHLTQNNKKITNCNQVDDEGYVWFLKESE